VIALAYVFWGFIALSALVGAVMFALLTFGAVREAWRAAWRAELDRTRRATSEVDR
jgi:hypothetical protein